MSGSMLVPEIVATGGEFYYICGVCSPCSDQVEPTHGTPGPLALRLPNGAFICPDCGGRLFPVEQAIVSAAEGDVR